MRSWIAPLVFVAPAAFAGGGDFMQAEILFLGELHDNPAHHQRQAEIVADASPAALVFEMLTPQQAARVTPELIDDATALEATLGWNASGWPDFAMYHPIFAAAPEAAVYGAAVPRPQARRVMDEGTIAVFGEDAALYGLTEPLPKAQQDTREALQLAAHCDAMPVEMLPMMVDIQRLRDAAIARVTLEAFQATGGPVAVITGNGHARLDWGAPDALARVAPELEVWALGQGEVSSGDPEGEFHHVEISADAERGDPCEAFR